MPLLPLAAMLVAQARAPALMPPRSIVIREGECYAMVQSGDQVVSTRLPDLHVIAATSREGPLVLEAPAGTGAIACPRSSILPAPDDWKVTEAGYPLMIMESLGDSPGRRVGALEVSGGALRFRMVSGELSDTERAELQLRLNRMQEAGRTPPR